MNARHRALAVLVAVIWGVNFVAIDFGLRDVPPLVLTALRFTACALPLVFLVPRPTSGLRYVLGYGIVLGVVKFGLLFTAMANGMPAGLASLVLQSQALFSILLATVFLGERMRRVQVGGVLLASAGIVALAWGKGAHATAIGFALTLASAAAWAVANIITKRSGEQRPLSMLAYSSLVPPIPLLALSMVLDGPDRTLHTLTHLSGRAILSILYIAYISTLLGFGLWNLLIAEHTVSRIAPFSLLVPIAGLLASYLFLDQALTWQLGVAAVTVLAGLSLVVRPRKQPKMAEAFPALELSPR